jgi:hypothetical protein
MRDVAVILTTYNRPKLVADAIKSVLNQTCDRWRLYIMDDGCDEDSREAIRDAVGGVPFEVVSPPGITQTDSPVIWWQGADRTHQSRFDRVGYSYGINMCLNYLIRDEKYVTYLCDDDYFYPDSVGCRAKYLDEHPPSVGDIVGVDVVYGRLRAVQYGQLGCNRWDSIASAIPGMSFPNPTGERKYKHNGHASVVFFGDNDKEKRDSSTGLHYVEEGFFLEGSTRYPIDGKCDHNQLMHRTDCLRRPIYPYNPGGYTEFWDERRQQMAGDEAFFTILGSAFLFYGVPELVVTKRYHSHSDGVVQGAVRE